MGVQKKICAIPYNISTPVMYYNKDLFEKSGLDPDSPPTTWEELLETAKAITKDVGGYHRFSCCA